MVVLNQIYGYLMRFEKPKSPKNRTFIVAKNIFRRIMRLYRWGKNICKFYLLA